MSVRPKYLSEVVGQAQAKENLDILVRASKRRNRPIPHTLLIGSAGTGKTTLARALAEEMESNFYQANGANLRNVKKLLPYLHSLRHQDILFIDEIHRMPIMVSETLYTVMEDFRLDYSDEKTGDFYNDDIPEFTLIGATTIVGKLAKPLKDRFKHVQELAAYNINELANIAKNVAAKEKIDGQSVVLPDGIATLIAQTSKENPRKVVARTEWVLDYIAAKNVTRLSQEQVMDVLKMQGVDQYGLEDVDRRYLETVGKNGTASLKYLAAALDIDEETVENDIEPFLLRKGIIGIDKRGRFINVKS